MYKVIRYFIDLEDNNHAYHVGDTFPRDGKKVSVERINALLSGDNKRKAKMIVEDTTAVSEPKEEAQEEPREEPQEEPQTVEEPKKKEAPKQKASSKSKKKIKEG